MESQIIESQLYLSKTAFPSLQCSATCHNYQALLLHCFSKIIVSLLSLAHLITQVFFYIPLKHQKSSDFLIFQRV